MSKKNISQTFHPVYTVFGESPSPDLDPRKLKKKPTSSEAAGIIRGLIIVTGVFITLALAIVFVSQMPTTPDMPGHPDMGEIEKLRAAEEAKLNNYGWVNQRSGIVRIPIKEAMSILAERGLPHRQVDTTTNTTDADKTNDNTNPVNESGESTEGGTPSMTEIAIPAIPEE